MRRFLISAVSAAIVAGVAFTASPLVASAANSTASSIVMGGVVGANGATAQPSLGSTVWFDSTYPKGTKNPVVDTQCYQNGTIVWGEVDSVSYASSPGVLLGGGSSPWLSSGGAASCVALLQDRYFKSGTEQIINLAQTSFSASA